uniref:Uncharacterized protein n=1 Tax=Anguilla anguilla TaxID=7936 RepID=A0A0E9RRV9_ANGAN
MQKVNLKKIKGGVSLLLSLVLQSAPLPTLKSTYPLAILMLKHFTSIH